MCCMATRSELISDAFYKCFNKLNRSGQIASIAVSMPTIPFPPIQMNKIQQNPETVPDWN